MPTKQTDYKRQFNAENYDRIEISIKKGAKADLQAAAQGKGESVSKYIKGAIEARYNADTGKEIKL